MRPLSPNHSDNYQLSQNLPSSLTESPLVGLGREMNQEDSRLNLGTYVKSQKGCKDL